MYHHSKEAAAEAAAKQVQAATDSDQWLIASFRFKEGKVYLDDTTFEFPNAALQEALILLQQSLSMRLHSAPPQPLPVAGHVTQESEGVTNEVGQ